VIAGFLDVPGIDGFLVGGASLNYHDFAGIVAAARHWQRGKEET
jgi:triosephosphate isomerase